MERKLVGWVFFFFFFLLFCFFILYFGVRKRKGQGFSQTIIPNSIGLAWLDSIANVEEAERVMT